VPSIGLAAGARIAAGPWAAARAGAGRLRGGTAKWLVPWTSAAAAMFLYPPITRLQDAADAHARLNDAFKDVFVPMCRVAKERPPS
jgi:hypothetical protein